ncbi:MAG: serine/threonine-protein phosphatase [Candidatus Hydrogenedentes bacterium]|nr:serine/threonine-protein phosphatase [Candidatus Hydrogenedentota bacterium]
MRMDIAAQTDVGRRKRTNEDCFGVFREETPGLRLFENGALLCVADGLGGHTGGEIASKLAVSYLKDMLKEPPPAPREDTEEDEGPLPLIRDRIKAANDNLHRQNLELVKSGRPMGTTLLAALVTPKKVYVGNVGDSRCYHLRDGEIIARTVDHSWVDEQVKLGLMSRSEAESDNRRNLVTRSIGTQPDVEIDSYLWHIVPGDMLLLCSDGLVNMVKDTDLCAVFKRRGSAAEIAQRLINLANEHGGTDNITAIVAHISPSLPRLLSMRLAAILQKYGLKLLWGLITALIGLACFAGGYYLGLGAK